MTTAKEYAQQMKAEKEAHTQKCMEKLDEARVNKLEAALQKAVDDYGKPGGPWNVPREAGTWISMAREALNE